MKKILLSIIGIIASISMFAQSPNAFSYQAVARASNGGLITNQAVSFKISILQGSTNGTSVYSEIHSPTTNKYGLVNLQIGNGASGDDFSAINWASGPYFVKVEMDVTGGTMYTEMGTSQLLNVPYALYADIAKISDTADVAKTFNKLTNKGSELCNAANEGTMRYNAINKVVEYCNSTSWIVLGGGLSVSIPTLSTTTISSIGATTAISGGVVGDNGGAEIIEKGVCWDTAVNPTTTKNKTLQGTGSAPYSSNLTGLISNDVYFVRAYATNTAGTAYGDQQSFITMAMLSTTSASNNSLIGFSTGGDVTIGGGEAVTARGVVYGTSSAPTTSGTKTTDGTGTGTFATTISSLPNNTKYFIRSYATNACGTNYGYEITTATLANLTTTDQSSATLTTVSVGGDIAVGGGATITSRGVAYGTSTMPTTSGTKTTDGTGTGTFTTTISSLANNTLYYYRAYATNEGGTNYGTEKTAITLAMLSTTSASNHSLTGFSTGGDITVGGGEDVTVRGVAYGTSTAPTTSGTKTTDGTGTGTFTTTISSLPNNTKYFIRSYATNASGTSYGSEKTTATLASLTTTDQSSATLTTVSVGGDIAVGGGATITSRGVAYGTSTMPTTSGTKTINGTGTGIFVSTISGLPMNTKYFIRSYATNEGGTNYGTEKTATTLANVSATNDATFLSYTSFSTGGTIDAGGGATVTERGIVYGLTTNPTKANNFVTAGSGSGSFTATITGLQDTVYYYRAYAINNGGISYGPERLSKDYKINFNGILYIYPIDNSTGVQWYNGSYIATGAASTIDGETNTNKIITTQGAGVYAAKVCADLVAYGYDDWYLPAEYELEAMMISNLSEEIYWSSTESDTNLAYVNDNKAGNSGNRLKTESYRVRCVRRD